MALKAKKKVFVFGGQEVAADLPGKSIVLGYVRKLRTTLTKEI